MSWGHDLWDQYDSISSYTKKGIDFLEKYGQFLDQRCRIEKEYASKLRRLVKTFIPKEKHDEDEGQFTCIMAYKNVLNELGDQAGQHEVIAENLSTSVVPEIASLVKLLKEDKKKHFNEGALFRETLISSMSTLTKAKNKYEKALNASEKALQSYRKADADLNLSRAEVEKQRKNSTLKAQQCDDAKNEYAYQLQQTNIDQEKYYTEDSPLVLNNIQDLEHRRIKSFRDFILKSVQIERDVFPIISHCLDGMRKSAESIDEKEDSRLVVEMYKSGFQSPDDILFDDLSCGKKSTIPIAKQGSRQKSKYFNLFSNNPDEFAGLPPNQRKKKLQRKIAEVTRKICKETSARDGLMKMKQVYESNTLLGDPTSIQAQLTENSLLLDKLREEQKKYEDMLGSDSNNQAFEVTSASSSANSLRRSISLSVKPICNSSVDISTTEVKLHTISVPRRNSFSGVGDTFNRPEILVSNAEVPSNLSNTNNENRGQKISGVMGSGSSNGHILAFPNITDNPTQHDQDGMSSKFSTIQRSPGHTSRSSLNAIFHTDHANSTVENNNVDGEEEFPDSYDLDPLPILGRCKALYQFEATDEGSIRMEKGEHLWVIKTDKGDGWTSVRKNNISDSDPIQEGFVPSSYIESCELYSTARPIE